MLPALGVIGAVVSLIVFDACKKLHRGVLGKVVRQPLPVKAQAKAVFPHQSAVAMNGF